MKMLTRAAFALLAAFACVPAMAQHATTSAAPAGFAPEQTCVTWSGGSIGAGTLVPCPATAGGGGGGGGDASAANQATQITAEQAIRDRLGEVQASPTPNTMNDRLKSIATNTGTTATNSTTNAGYNAPFAGLVGLTVGTAVSGANIGRSWMAVCTAAGNVALTFSNASTGSVAVQVGTNILPFAITTVSSSGTTATCTYSNLL